MTLIKVVKSPFYISVKAMEQHQHLVVHPNTYFFQLLDFIGVAIADFVGGHGLLPGESAESLRTAHSTHSTHST